MNLQLCVRDLNSDGPTSTHVGRSKDIGHATARSELFDAVVVEHLAARIGVMVSGHWNR
jgi:hypothetical protein